MSEAYALLRRIVNNHMFTLAQKKKSGVADLLAVNHVESVLEVLLQPSF